MAGSTMSDPRELFLHELGDVLYAEQTLVKALPKLKEEASDEELAKGLPTTLRRPVSMSRTSSSPSKSWESRQRRRSVRGSRGSRRSTTSSWPTSPLPRRYSTRS